MHRVSPTLDVGHLHCQKELQLLPKISIASHEIARNGYHIEDMNRFTSISSRRPSIFRQQLGFF